MVITGKPRGNGVDLGAYLLRLKDNTEVYILEVEGELRAKPADLYRSLYKMDISSELSNGDLGLYHAQINPAPGEDKDMTDDDWLQSADILGRQLGLANQSRAIVMHTTKKGRKHAHVVWERFDYDKGKFISDSFSRLAQDRARKEMELVFEHKKTPHRNIHRAALKEQVTGIWNTTKTGKEFIKILEKNNLIIGQGVGRHPFMVIDQNARSYDLNRQIKGAKLKDIRTRLRNEELLTEKQAIEKAQQLREDKNSDKGKAKGSADKEKQSNLLKDYREAQRETLAAFLSSQKTIEEITKPNHLDHDELVNKRKKDKGFDLDFG